MYEGEKNEDGEPHGIGLKTYKNGNEYRGQWKNGEQDGYGKMVYANPKVLYEGHWQEGKPHGYGKEIILHGKGTNGDIYEGCWANGKFIGGQNCKVTKANRAQYEGEMLNKASHGKGTYIHSNGNKYTGDFWRGKMSGTGKYVSANGKTKYSGEFKNDTFHGQGTLEEDGDIHTGRFSSGLRHGQGVLTYANGDVFTGRFWKGQMHGRGKLTTNAGAEYDGEWCKGKANGNGTFKDGQYEYSGSWKGGKKHGKGVAKDSEKIYSGDFVDDEFHGKGELTYSNGDTFVGEFKAGEKYKGLFSFASNGEKYDGQFLNNEFCEGTFFYADKEIYVGQFVGSKSHGYGEHTYRDGSLFKGQWKEDMMHGEGKLTKINGDIYEGAWVNDRKHGYFTYTCSTGEVFKERYENDKRLLCKKLCPVDKNSLSPGSKTKETNQSNAGATAEEISKQTSHSRNPKERPPKRRARDDSHLKDGKVKNKEDGASLQQNECRHQTSVKEEQEYPQASTCSESSKGITDAKVVTPSHESNAAMVTKNVEARKGGQISKNPINHKVCNNAKRVRKLQFFELYEEIKSQLANSDSREEAKSFQRHLKAWFVHKTKEPGFKASSFDAARLRCVMQYFEDTLEKLVNAEKKQDGDDICLYKFQLDTIIEDCKEEYSIFRLVASVPVKSEEDN